jgi:hypothetical protein
LKQKLLLFKTPARFWWSFQLSDFVYRFINSSIFSWLELWLALVSVTFLWTFTKLFCMKTQKLCKLLKSESSRYRRRMNEVDSS